jgi:hypothetical protein
VNFEQGQFFVYHILEALEKDLGKEITERKTARRVPSEAEARNFLVQMTQALAYAHSKRIAHRDIKPGNIFLDREGTFKVRDFGTFYEKKASMPATTGIGTLAYMSPQQRKIITGETQGYNAFKSDVYSLGLTTLSLASMTLFAMPWPLNSLKSTARAKVQELGYSAELKNLLLAMLEEREETRPTMQEVFSTLMGSDIRSLAPATSILHPSRTEETKSTPAALVPLKGALTLQFEEENATELVQVTSTYLCFFHFQTSTWGPKVNLSIYADQSSNWVMLEERVLCCGGFNDGFGFAGSYIISRDGVVEQDADMIVERWDHGLQTACNAAYVFGGEGLRNCKTCEKWELATNQWSELPSMRIGRLNFNPCLLEGRIYLCGGQYIEVFDPQTDTFLHQFIDLPTITCCYTYVHNHLLVVHSSNYICKFSVAQERTLGLFSQDGEPTLLSQVRSPEINISANSQPVVDKAKGVYYINQHGECVCIEIENGFLGPTVPLE